MGRRLNTKSYKKLNPKSISKNPLFKALNIDKTKDVEINPLLARLGSSTNTKTQNLSHGSGNGGKSLKNKDVNRLRNNPLATALGLSKPSILPQSRNPELILRRKNNNASLKSNFLKNEEFLKSKSRSKNVNSGDKSSKQIEAQESVTFSDALSFKNASRTPFLRIKNLSSGVTESDIAEVMSTYGVILKILAMECVNSSTSNTSVTAEIFYLEDQSLQKATELNRRKADNRILSVEIAIRSCIINSTPLWNSIVDEVRFSKQEYLRQKIAGNTVLTSASLISGR